MSIDLTSSKDITKKRGAGFQRTLFGGVADVKKEDGIKRAKTAKSEAKTSGVSSQSLLTSNDGLEASYKPLRNESYEVRSTRCHELMKKTFKIDQLRKQQPKAVECALKGQSQVIVMATGGGKSLCYQLPAVVLGGVTVVISPLIALMRDQVSSLTKKGVSAACINSSNKTKENDDILDRVVGRKLKTTKKSGETVLRPISIIYVTPESLQTTSFQNILNELNHKRRLTMFAIDEAHCMSSWGHDFRYAYRKLDYLEKSFPTVPRMALTATATPNVIEDIKNLLHLETAPCHVGSFDRPNIFYKVHYKDGLEALKPGRSLEDISTFIRKQHKRAKKAGTVKCSGIVYVHKRNDTKFLANEITKRTGIRAVGYHGAMKDADRTKIQQDWTSGAVQIAVATIALGMGIDLGHVRYVIHWSIPKTMDGFYQESGRAGRDEKPAISLVYFSREDVNKFAFIHRKEEEKQKDKGRLQRKLDALQKVVDYCVKPQCRRQFVLQHFGEKETDPKTVCMKSCDFCDNPGRIEQAIQAADSMRAITRQKEEAKKRSKEQKWDGQWSAPHGDDGFFDGANEAWEVDGLGITGSAKVKSSFKGSTAFVSAKTLASRLDSLEAMEMQENESNGFVHYKSKKNHPPMFPEHFKERLEKIPLSTNAAKAEPKERSSSEIAASADKLRAELAAIEAKQKALLGNRGSKAAGQSIAPPPPAFGAKKSNSK